SQSEELLDEIHRAGAIAEELAAEHRPAQEQLGAFVVAVDGGALGLEQLLEIAPRLAVGVEALERLVGRQITGLELEDLPVPADGAIDVAEDALGELAQR